MKNAMPNLWLRVAFYFYFSITRLACLRYKLFNPLALERARRVTRAPLCSKNNAICDVVLEPAENTHTIVSFYIT
jgi:hypothetical protein